MMLTCHTLLTWHARRADDADGALPAYGFGAQLPDTRRCAVHSFPLNGDARNPACAGVAGVLAAYRQALSTVTLDGPTCFAPVIKACADAAQASLSAPGPGKYFVLLLITDGTRA